MAGDSLGASLLRILRRNAWVAGLWIVLVLLLLLTKLIQPDYGPSGITALALAALPFAFATAGQTVAIIGGGLDLSIAAMMALISVIAASLMAGQGEEFGLLAVPLILLVGMALGAVNGLTIVLTRIPDIVVTLAFFFIWEGVALLVLDTPGGDASNWLKQLILGTVGAPGVPAELSQWVPKSLILLIVALGIVWLPLSRFRLGLSIYAIGSNRQAAFRSGVPVDRTKIASLRRDRSLRGHGRPHPRHDHRQRQPHPGALPAGQRRGGRARRREPGRRPGRPRGPHRGHLHPAPRAPGPRLPVGRPQRRPGRRGRHHGRRS